MPIVSREIVSVDDTHAVVRLWEGRINVEATARILPLQKLWESRQEAMNQEPENKERWDKTMSEEQARVAREMILHAFHTLQEDLDWVPHRTEIQDGQVLDVNIRVLLTDVDEEVRRQETQFLKTLDSARGNALRLDEEDHKVVRGEP